jgi:peptidoglycan/xylan/chitin deacetylase (PgdA/CDA1 family)
MRGLPYLMYHEIARPGVATARSDPGYMRYVISDSTFEQHLGAIAEAGMSGVSVGDAVAAGNDRTDVVALTFDDGCESDLAVAAPRLADRGWTATFYVTVAHVGRPGFLSRTQLRQLADLGFQVGSHAFTHTYLTSLDAQNLRTELSDSRRWLEDVTGREVRHFSCPGGRWSPLVAECAAACGYASVAVSRPVPNPPGADVFRLGRFAVTTATDARTFRFMMHGQLPFPARCLERATSLSRSFLGDRRYDALRARVLRG